MSMDELSDDGPDDFRLTAAGAEWRRTACAYQAELAELKQAMSKAPTHAAAVSGCTGTGEDGVELTWLWTDRHGWRLSHYGACLVSNGLRAPEGCTATTAVLEGVTR
jgi:hypothetical protein